MSDAVQQPTDLVVVAKQNDAPIAVVMVNRPKALNALNVSTVGELLRMTSAVPGRDYLTIGSGVAVRSANIEVFADYDATLPVDNVTRHSISAGLRYRF